MDFQRRVHWKHLFCVSLNESLYFSVSIVFYVALRPTHRGISTSTVLSVWINGQKRVHNPFLNVYWAVDHLLALCALIRLPIDYSSKFASKTIQLNQLESVAWQFVCINFWLMISASVYLRSIEKNHNSFDLCCLSNSSTFKNGN